MATRAQGSNVEVTSQQLLNELLEIKDRVGALENVAGIANQDILIKYFADIINSEQRRQIMCACRTPQTSKQLVSQCNFNSRQALDHHLKPLREGLVHEVHIDGVVHFEWSLLFKRMPKSKVEVLLGTKRQAGRRNG